MAFQTIVETPEFMKRASALGLSDTERRDLVNQLAANPEAGVALSGGLRKLRVPRAGGAKSGGYRVLYLYHSPGIPLFLLTLFAKKDEANISRSEKADLIKLCNLIAETYGKKL